MDKGTTIIIALLIVMLIVEAIDVYLHIQDRLG